MTPFSVFLPPSLPEAVLIKVFKVRVHTGGLAEGRSDRLLSEEDAHSVGLRDGANIVVSRGHCRWCPAYVRSEQALLNTTEVASDGSPPTI